MSVMRAADDLLLSVSAANCRVVKLLIMGPRQSFKTTFCIAATSANVPAVVEPSVAAQTYVGRAVVHSMPVEVHLHDVPDPQDAVEFMADADGVVWVSPDVPLPGVLRRYGTDMLSLVTGPDGVDTRSLDAVHGALHDLLQQVVPAPAPAEPSAWHRMFGRLFGWS